MHKAGFVNIVGYPNVGKSTLMNAITGEKLSIITRKAQTTRHRILGIVNQPDCQIVFSDTPGILKPHYRLHQVMMKQVSGALTDADIILYLAEAGQKPPEEDDFFSEIRKTGIPLFLVINKIDKAEPECIAETEQAWKTRMPDACIFRISAINKLGLDVLIERIVETLPESPPYYSGDELTDRPLRFFVSEIIREKVLVNYSKEIPYSVEIVVESYKESEDIIRIQAILFVIRESQKAIILGHKGEAIRRMGIQARKDLESYLGKHVHLDLTVKVSDNWRDNDQMLMRFGYEL